MKQDNGGLRYNEGKAPMHLIPPDAILELAKVFDYGAQKYAPRNWERGMDWSDMTNSLERHLAAFKLGEDRDPESGLPHMSHVAWNALALLTYVIRQVGIDDRATPLGNSLVKIRGRAGEDTSPEAMLRGLVNPKSWKENMAEAFVDKDKELPIPSSIDTHIRKPSPRCQVINCGIVLRVSNKTGKCKCCHNRVSL